jgi:formylglycine-generating enzyme required for sulfatase activity
MTRLPAVLVLLVVAACGDPVVQSVGGPTGRAKTIEDLLFVEISPGRFRMGTEVPGEGAMVRVSDASQPVHEVTIAKPIWVATTEVTNVLYRKFRPDFAPAEQSPGDRHPAVGMTQGEARAFCAWLTEKHPGTFRLPSEAEWEYVARAGNPGIYSFGDDAAALPKHAWFRENSGGTMHPVGGLRASAWGLFDIHGNAAEWTADKLHMDYKGAPADGSAWTEGMSKRVVVRGGGFDDPAFLCRVGLRSFVRGDDQVPDGPIGIRVVAEFTQ